VKEREKGEDIVGTHYAWSYPRGAKAVTDAAGPTRWRPKSPPPPQLFSAAMLSSTVGSARGYKSSVRPPTVLRPPFLFVLGLLGLSAGHGSALARGHCRVWPSGYGRVVEKEMSFVLLDWKSTHAIRSCSNETWAFGSYVIGHD
jgi:hypothetical protein